MAGLRPCAQHGPSHHGRQLGQDLLEDDRPVVLTHTLNLADGGVTSSLVPTHQIAGGNRCVQTNAIDAKLHRALLDKADKSRAEPAVLLHRVNSELCHFGVSNAAVIADPYLHGPDEPLLPFNHKDLATVHPQTRRGVILGHASEVEAHLPKGAIRRVDEARERWYIVVRRAPNSRVSVGTGVFGREARQVALNAAAHLICVCPGREFCCVPQGTLECLLGPRTLAKLRVRHPQVVEIRGVEVAYPCSIGDRVSFRHGDEIPFVLLRELRLGDASLMRDDARVVMVLARTACLICIAIEVARICDSSATRLSTRALELLPDARVEARRNRSHRATLPPLYEPKALA